VPTRAAAAKAADRALRTMSAVVFADSMLCKVAVQRGVQLSKSKRRDRGNDCQVHSHVAASEGHAETAGAISVGMWAVRGSERRGCLGDVLEGGLPWISSSSERVGLRNEMKLQVSSERQIQTREGVGKRRTEAKLGGRKTSKRRGANTSMSYWIRSAACARPASEAATPAAKGVCQRGRATNVPLHRMRVTY
jgi:hypothetical protein